MVTWVSSPCLSKTWRSAASAWSVIVARVLIQVLGRGRAVPRGSVFVDGKDLAGLGGEPCPNFPDRVP